MPRAYRLGRRSELKDATRARVVQAAIDLYIELGISGTSVNAIARRADVAVGTVRNHFPTRQALEEAIVQRAQAEMPVPGLDIFNGAEGIAARVERLCRATGTFLVAAEPWYRMWQRERMVSGPWAAAGAAAGAGWDRLCRFALGPLADDPAAMVILRATMVPEYVAAVRTATGSADAAADLIAASIAPWLERRATGL